MFIAYICFPTVLTFPTKASLALIAVEHVFRETFATAVFTALPAIDLRREFHRLLTEVASTTLEFNQFLIIFPLFR